VALVTEAAIAAPSPQGATAALESLVQKSDAWDGAKPHGVLPTTTPKASAVELLDQATVLGRRLERTLRALRQEAGGRASPAALRVLSQDAVRLLVEQLGTRRLAELQATPAKGPVQLRASSPEAVVASQLAGLLSSSRPDRHAAIAQLVLASPSSKAAAQTATATGELLSHTEKAALADILTTLDPAHGALVREKLAGGATVDDVRHLLVERLVPVTLAVDDATATSAGAASDAPTAGLKFDLGLNKWVQNDKSWRYDVRLAQIFEYQVDGIIDGTAELKARLVTSSLDPTTGEAAVPQATVEAFVDDLAAAIASDHPVVRKLLDAHTDMIFTTTDGGDKPAGAAWELPTRSVADLFAAMTDPSVTSTLHDVAELARAESQARRAKVMGPLQELLAQHTGVPRRHKRAHAALINMGIAGQSVAEMGREGGVLPRSKTLLDPTTLATTYKDADNLKMRFLLSDEYEMFVLSDVDFEAVVKKWGFPPNHELLSYNRPIAGSGYVKIDKGVIVGLEDDVVMLKGKLPEGLAPALDVLRLRGFALDEKSIQKSSHVLDFEALRQLGAGALGAGGTSLPKAPTGTPAQIASALQQAPHVDRPALAIAVVRDAIAAELQKGVTLDVARSKAEPLVALALAGLHIVNTSRKDFREGRLPRELNESSELVVDASLASYLTRLVSA
jgi:hypothetical protein